MQKNKKRESVNSFFICSQSKLIKNLYVIISKKKQNYKISLIDWHDSNFNIKAVIKKPDNT